jgi:cellulose synthase (UDP-forming)
MVATLIAFIIPIAVLLTGAQTSTANPLIFAAVFSAMFSARLWGAIPDPLPTAFALRIS